MALEPKNYSHKPLVIEYRGFFIIEQHPHSRRCRYGVIRWADQPEGHTKFWLLPETWFRDRRTAFEAIDIWRRVKGDIKQWYQMMEQRDVPRWQLTQHIQSESYPYAPA